MSPVFDGKNIFDSTDPNGDTFTEGMLTVLDYGWIKQTLHFNGERGNRYLFHGNEDRRWFFEGYLSANSIDELFASTQVIESYIDATALNSGTTPVNGGTYFTMSDSFGSPYAFAQIHNFHYLEYPHIRTDGGYVCRIRVDGVVLGQEQEG